MDSALGWIGAIAEWFGKFFPRWQVIDPTQAAVKMVGWSFRKSRREPRTVYQRRGIVFWWPAVTEIYVFSVAELTKDLPVQTIETTDGKIYAVKAVISYDIPDLMTLLTTVSEPDKSIEDCGSAAVHEAVVAYDAAGLTAADRSGELGRKMKSEAYYALKDKGVRVTRVRLMDLAQTRCYRMLMSERDSIL